ncbi:hypothetical protein [Embleya sp. NPDC020886]|uniref:hypothetical protein n=1 Tax=Embleya sp. NPDC020886 TaxID=3363980 RepID=UPI0037A539C5
MAHPAIPGGPPPIATLTSYVTNHRSDTVTVLDVVTGTALATIDVPGVLGVAAVPGGSVYVTSPERGVITVIDTESPVVLGRIAARWPYSPVAAPDARAVYFASCPPADDGCTPYTIEVLSTTLNTVVRSYPVPAPATVLAPAPGGGRLYLGTFDRDLITVLDLADGSTTSGTTKAPRGLACAPDGVTVYVAGEGGVDILDAATLGRLGTIAIDGGATDVAVSPDGSRLYVVPAAARDLRIADPVTRAVIGSVDTPNAGAVTLTSGGTRAVVMNVGSGDGVVASIVDTADDTILYSVPIGRSPFHQAFVGSAGALPVTRTGSWAAPVDLGGTIVGGPGVTLDRYGRVAVFAHGADAHHVCTRAERPDGEWTPWVDLGEPIDGAPVAARALDGRLLVFFRAGDALRLLCRAGDDETWLAARTLADGVVGDPVVGFGASGRPEVYYRGTDGGLWHVRPDTGEADGGRPAAERLGGGPVAGGIPAGASTAGMAGPAGMATVRDGEGRQVLVHVDPAGRVWSIRQQGPDGPWAEFEPVLDGALPDRPPTVAVGADGRAQVVVVGADGALWTSIAGKDGWGEPEPLFGAVGGAVRAIAAVDGRIVVVVRGTDGVLWVKGQTGPETDDRNEYASLAPDAASDPVPVLDGSGCLRIAYRAEDESVRVVGQTRM